MEQFEGKEKIQQHKIELGDNRFVMVAEESPGYFRIVSDNFTQKHSKLLEENKNVIDKWRKEGRDEKKIQEYFPGEEHDECLGAIEQDNEVEVLDKDGDSFNVLGVSSHLKWEDVEIDFDDESIRAPSLDRIKEALQHIKIEGYSPFDI